MRGVDQAVGQVAGQLHQQPEQGEDEQAAEHHRVVAAERRFVAHQAEAVEGEQHLDQQRPGEEHRDQRRRQPGHHQQHGVAEHMAVEHPALAEPFGASGGDVLPGYLVEEAVLGQQGQGGETADHQRTHRQRQVPEVIGEARQRAEALGAPRKPGRAGGTSPGSCRRRTARSGRWRRGSRAPHSRPPPARCSTGRRRCRGAPPWPPPGESTPGR
ncbi:Uncharacterised protein [Pseudomonas aeruginosa]|nr:Uncharacterised protein [Pseudomonas aeruginosa]